MPQINYNGQIHNFPDTFSDAQISDALGQIDKESAPPPEAKSVMGFLGNVKQSGTDLVTGTASGLANILNPDMAQNTLANLGKLGAGALSKAIPDGMYHPTSMSQYEPMANAVGEHYKERYGGLDKIGNTAYSDPLGMASDLASILSLGAGSVSKGAKLAQVAKVAGESGMVANIGSKAAGVARVAANADPLTAVMSRMKFKAPQVKAKDLATQKVMDWIEAHPETGMTPAQFGNNWAGKLVNTIAGASDRVTTGGRWVSNLADEVGRKAKPLLKQEFGTEAGHVFTDDILPTVKKANNDLYDAAAFPHTEAYFNPNHPEPRLMLPEGRGPGVQVPDGPRFVSGQSGTVDVTAQNKAYLQSSGKLDPLAASGTLTPGDIGERSLLPPNIAAQHGLGGRPLTETAEQATEAMRMQVAEAEWLANKAGRDRFQPMDPSTVDGQRAANLHSPSTAPVHVSPTFSPEGDPRALPRRDGSLEAVPGDDFQPPRQRQPGEATTLESRPINRIPVQGLKDFASDILKKGPLGEIKGALTGENRQMVALLKRVELLPDTLSHDALKRYRTLLGKAMAKNSGAFGSDYSKLQAQLYHLESEGLNEAARGAGKFDEWTAANANYGKMRDTVGNKELRRILKASPENLIGSLDPQRPGGLTRQQNFDKALDFGTTPENAPRVQKLKDNQKGLGAFLETFAKHDQANNIKPVANAIQSGVLWNFLGPAGVALDAAGGAAISRAIRNPAVSKALTSGSKVKMSPKMAFILSLLGRQGDIVNPDQ